MHQGCEVDQITADLALYLFTGPSQTNLDFSGYSVISSHLFTRWSEQSVSLHKLLINCLFWLFSFCSS